MCSHVHIAESGISTYVPPRLLVGPVRISVQVPCGAGVALQRSTSMQQVRKLVSKKELKTVHGIPYSFAHIARLEKAGTFPKRIQLGACRVAWFEDEVEGWKASRPRAA
jgi:prophage regulatory protein